MAGVKGQKSGVRKSVKELQLSGTFRADRHGHLLAQPEKLTIIEPQEHLLTRNINPDRKKIFEMFAKELYESGQSQEIDSVIISQLVELYVMWLEALDYSKSSPDAMFGKSLASVVAMNFAKEIRSIMAEFRLTPSTRNASPERKKEIETDPVGAFLEMKVVND